MYQIKFDRKDYDVQAQDRIVSQDTAIITAKTETARMR
jgi:hypothetical protein